MRTPSFGYMGGKSRLRKWLVSRFPKSGRRYVEPFSGRGNVFFQARKDLDFQEWHLSDIDTVFFRSILSADLDKLPQSVSRNDFPKWKNADNDIAKLIEPAITFAGKGYQAGFRGEHKSHPPYNGNLYRKTCEEARRLLCDTTIRESSWDGLDYTDLTQDDFIYLDPPYFGTKASYPNISHDALVKFLNSTDFRWALSGYDNALYSNALKFTSRHQRERNSEIKSSNTRRYEAVTEILWIGGPTQ